MGVDAQMDAIERNALQHGRKGVRICGDAETECIGSVLEHQRQPLCAIGDFLQGLAIGARGIRIVDPLHRNPWPSRIAAKKWPGFPSPVDRIDADSVLAMMNEDLLEGLALEGPLGELAPRLLVDLRKVAVVDLLARHPVSA